MNLPVTAGDYALMFYCKFNRNRFDICSKTTNWLRNHEERSSDVSLVWHGYHVSLWRWECFCIISSISIFPYRAPWADLVSTSPRSSEVPGWHGELLKRLHFSLDEEMRRATVSREMKISAHGWWGAIPYNTILLRLPHIPALPSVPICDQRKEKNLH